MSCPSIIAFTTFHNTTQWPLKDASRKLLSLLHIEIDMRRHMDRGAGGSILCVIRSLPIAATSFKALQFFRVEKTAAWRPIKAMGVHANFILIAQMHTTT